MNWAAPENPKRDLKREHGAHAHPGVASPIEELAHGAQLPTKTGLAPRIQSVRKNTRGFPRYLPTRPKNKFGDCLPVLQYSTVQYCTVLQSVL